MPVSSFKTYDCSHGETMLLATSNLQVEESHLTSLATFKTQTQLEWKTRDNFRVFRDLI